MLKPLTIILLTFLLIWQILRIQTLHKEIDCIGRIVCYSCQTPSTESPFKNYFTAIDSIENTGRNFIKEDLRSNEELQNGMRTKSSLEFRPYITDVVIGDSITSFQLEIAHFTKITDGYIYHNGNRSEYHSDDCLPAVFDSLVAYLVDDITGERRKMIHL